MGARKIKAAYTDKHFGKAEVFVVAEIDETGFSVIETRQIPAACRDCGNHDSGVIAAVIDALSDCGVIIAAKIGERVKLELSHKNIQALEFDGDAEKAFSGYAKYFARVHKNKQTAHPCFDNATHGKYGRIHLPVSAKCNIKCRFCERDFNTDEVRPGVSAVVLKPEQTVATVTKALELCPQIKVIGIAGPGDPLADNAAIETFRLLKDKFSDLHFCLSTNGYALPMYVNALYEAGVRHLTVTVNAATADTLSRIVTDVDAAELLRNQQNGIKAATGLGIEVKINTVFINDINDGEIEQIAEMAANLGAKRHNIMPLIPKAEFADKTSPNCAALNAARESAEKHLPVFRHCTHCRADACGIPGVSDVSKELYADTSGFRCNNNCG